MEGSSVYLWLSGRDQLANNDHRHSSSRKNTAAKGRDLHRQAYTATADAGRALHTQAMTDVVTPKASDRKKYLVAGSPKVPRRKSRRLSVKREDPGLLQFSNEDPAI